MGVPISIADAADLVDLSIQDVFVKEGKTQKKRVYPKYFNEITGITDYYTKDSSFTGLGLAGRIIENASVVAESPVQGFDKTYTQVEWGKVFTVTKLLWKFGIQKRKIESLAKSAINACERKRETLCADRVDNAFSTSYTVQDDAGNFTMTISGGNSVALCSASQTREDGGTNNNNRITDGTTVNMDIDYDAIKALHRTASLVLDGKGNKMDIMPDRLLFARGVAGAFRAKEILGAVKTGGARSLPSSAQNDAAGIPEFEVVEIPWITTNTGYWAATDSSLINDMYGLQIKEAQPIQNEGPNVVFRTGELQFKSTLMFDLGHNDYRGFFESKNTNAS